MGLYFDVNGRDPLGLETKKYRIMSYEEMSEAGLTENQIGWVKRYGINNVTSREQLIGILGNNLETNSALHSVESPMHDGRIILTLHLETTKVKNGMLIHTLLTQ